MLTRLMLELQNASKTCRGIFDVRTVSFGPQLGTEKLMTRQAGGSSHRCTLLLAVALTAGLVAPAALAQAAAGAAIQTPTVRIPDDRAPNGRHPTDQIKQSSSGKDNEEKPSARALALDGKGLAFEVVSIRPDRTSSPGHDQIGVTPNGWHMAHSPLIAALLTAYVPTTSDAMMYTVSTLVGVPDWMQTELYTIEAKVPESDLTAWQNPAIQPAMLRSMVQAMLAERCNLAVHRGSKEVGVYSLVIGRNGPRLKAAVPGEPHPGATPIPGGGEFLPNDGNGTASFFDAPIGALTVILANLAGRPVEDKTGLTGRYDMRFRRPRPGGPSLEADASSDPPPTIFEVVESLGLKLEAGKSSVQTLNIDHVDRPSDN
jgi:uncharacterized protein (TIGR03435 family)